MLAALLILAPAVLRVGPGETFPRLEAALVEAKPGDRVEIAAGTYPKTAARIIVPNLTIIGKDRPTLDGKGYDYSGEASTPRAILQIEADNVTVEGLILTGAHNESHNGAGLRVNAAKRATVRDCEITGNDDGIMSNGRKDDPTAGADQLYERLKIHRNGDPGEPGQNHNLYLGGTGATLRFCEISHSLTGHNLKSRAHKTTVEHCWIHDASQRELDLVDSWDTERPGSDALILGSVLTKNPKTTGNRGVIHFGQESGKRVGKLTLQNVTIDSPFGTAVVVLSGTETTAEIWDSKIRGPLPEGLIPKTGRPSPAFRWSGEGKWTPTKDRFLGAG